MNRDQKIKFLAAVEEKRRRRQAAPLFYFTPHAKQQRFFAGLESKRGVVFSGSNRCGKTVAHAVTAICHMYGYWIFKLPEEYKRLTEDGDYPPREEVPPELWIRRPDGVPLRSPATVLCITGLTLLKGIAQILWPEIENWLPSAVRARMKVQRGALSVPVCVTLPNGSVANFGSVEQGSMTFEGAKVDAAGFDEPPSRAVWSAVWRGLTDFYSPYWITFTPLGPHAPWLYTEFWGGEREDAEVIEITIDENPYLSAEARQEFIEGLACSEEELHARLSGQFGHLTYRAFPQFREDVHVVEPFQIPHSWPRVLACDPAHRRPYYFLWLAWDDVHQTWVAYREWPADQLHHTYRSSDKGVREYSVLLRTINGVERIDDWRLDPRFGVAEYTIKGQKTSSIADDFLDYGIFWNTDIPGTAREETGIGRIRDLLSWDTSRAIDPTNRPHLVVFPECKSLIFSLRNYMFVPPSAKDDNILPEKTSEALKDPIDTLRYGVLPGPPARAAGGSSYISDADWARANRDEWEDL